MQIEAISVKQVKTKFGLKDTSAIKCDDGQWYSLGFNKHTMNKGDEVEFEFENTKYGNVVKMETVKINGSAAPVVDKTSPKSFPAKGTYTPATSRPFPIPLLHGDRAIIRQNSITNSVKLVCDNTGIISAGNEDELVKTVIRIAQRFEEYSAGDLERREAEKNAAKSK